MLSTSKLGRCLIQPKLVPQDTAYIAHVPQYLPVPLGMGAQSSNSRSTGKGSFKLLFHKLLVLIYCTITTKGSRHVTRHLKGSLGSRFIDRQSPEIPINGRTAASGKCRPRIFGSFPLFQAKNRNVTVTHAELVQLTSPCHPSPEPLVVIVQYLCFQIIYI